jgi:hypothetical protein
LESNLYTGILNGGILSSTPGSTTFNITAGEGLVVTQNASTASAYHFQPLRWLSGPLKPIYQYITVEALKSHTLD